LTRTNENRRLFRHDNIPLAAEANAKAEAEADDLVDVERVVDPLDVLEASFLDFSTPNCWDWARIAPG
jgi:hypothetical protein